MDADFALALSLQFDDESEGPEILSNVNSPPSLDVGLATKNYFNGTLSSTSSAARRPLSVVDESWELIDPIPNIRDLFLQFNDAYFDGKLAGVEVKWSPKMTLCAGVCSYEGRGGLCSIRLSEPLLKLRPRKDLVQTLLHEMIHALLFVTQNNKDHDSHGPEFHKHMYRINQQSGANVTVYHSFHDEVNNYRQHWWKCDGPCRFRPPFYGIVRRSMNRAPSKNDNWWHEHSMSCGGKFHKIKEPEEYGKKSNKRKRDDDKGAETDAKVDNKSFSKSQDISKWFKSSQNSGKTIIKTINSYSSDETQKEERRNVFSGNGRSLLVPGEASARISKEEWIKQLMQKQAKLAQGKDSSNANNEREMSSESQPMERKAPSTVTLRADREEKENLHVKNRQRDHTIIDKKKEASLNEGVGLPLVSSSSKSPELAFKIISSTASSVRSPSISPLPITPSSFSSDAMTSSIPRGQSSGKKEKPDIVIIDSSPAKSILELVDCPACPKKIPVDSINMHLDQCLSRGV